MSASVPPMPSPDGSSAAANAAEHARANVSTPASENREAAPAVDVDIREIWYQTKLAVADAVFTVNRGSVTALIGPSGCGKSSVLRCINRMNDAIPGFRLNGAVRIDGEPVYDPKVDPTSVRRQVGMVFQQPNPFSSSIYSNVAFGPRINGMKTGLSDRVERALRRAALWDEVKDSLSASAASLSGGQQQRLCIARAIANDPSVLLMDEPCSALDPVAVEKIEELIRSLREQLAVVVVTHNLQQARRIADETAFFCVDDVDGKRVGRLAEFGTTTQLFENPRNPLTRDYISGRFG